MSARKLRLFHRLQLAAHHIQKSSDKEIKTAVDLTTSQAAVLSVLANGEGHTQRDIAKALGQNESAVTSMVNRLLKAGYLNRKRNPADTRAWNLQLNSNGRTALQATRQPFGKINRIIENELSKEEVSQLADYLERLSSAFRAEG